MRKIRCSSPAAPAPASPCRASWPPCGPAASPTAPCPRDWGTAANICSMVFGNMGDDSGTGVAFTRDPATGENVFYGEYLINAQGEDVVAGIRTPKKIAELQKDMPAVYKQLEEVRKA